MFVAITFLRFAFKSRFMDRPLLSDIPGSASAKPAPEMWTDGLVPIQKCFCYLVLCTASIYVLSSLLQ